MVVLMKLLPLMALLAPALAGPKEVICETSDASPSTEDTTAIINQFRGDGTDKWCTQKNNAESYCTTCGSAGSAKLAICGEAQGGIGSGVGPTHEAIAGWINELQQKCVSNGKVGGRYVIGGATNWEIDLSHS
ncbi:hypothetical protein PENSTE_c005G09062 [Penicillium steckii]|uniref:Ecp2 effector protein domain-containing protein n=1 Tax=Penicillium steckii TaxID=303698 RepID=A0A1V6TM01_9EURO|nr:hypothetical protein PENSTE_c005G09062 [Penicillium steckii]